MTDVRSYFRGALHGGVLVLVLAVAYNLKRDAATNAAIAAADSVSASAMRQHVADEIRKRAVLAQQRALDAYADSVSAETVALLARQTPRPQFTVTRISDPTPLNDTTAFVTVQRPIDPVPYRAPAYLVNALAETEIRAAQFFLAWQGELHARVFADTATIPTVLLADSSGNTVIGAQQHAINVRDDALHPRCGRKCGIVIGVLTTVGTAWAVDRVGAALHRRR